MWFIVVFCCIVAENVLPYLLEHQEGMHSYSELYLGVGDIQLCLLHFPRGDKEHSAYQGLVPFRRRLLEVIGIALYWCLFTNTQIEHW